VDRWIKEAAADHKIMAKRWGDLANRLGTVAEDVVAPNIRRVARRYFGMRTLDELRVRDRRKRGSNTVEEREFDVVAWDAARFIMVEAKGQANTRDAEALLSRPPELVDFYPEAAEREVVPILASFAIHESVLAYLTRHAVYRTVMRGGTMELANLDEVRAARPETRAHGSGRHNRARARRRSRGRSCPRARDAAVAARLHTGYGVAEDAAVDGKRAGAETLRLVCMGDEVSA
jgi:hypothetical protein